jgi:hypothetical protein
MAELACHYDRPGGPEKPPTKCCDYGVDRSGSGEEMLLTKGMNFYAITNTAFLIRKAVSFKQEMSSDYPAWGKGCGLFSSWPSVARVGKRRT